MMVSYILSVVILTVHIRRIEFDQHEFAVGLLRDKSDVANFGTSDANVVDGEESGK